MGLLIKNLVVSETAPVGYPGAIWIKYIREDNTFQIYLPVGKGWQYSNIALTSQLVTGALGYYPESTGNMVTEISESSTNTQYPSAKAVYDAISSSSGGGLEAEYIAADKELAFTHSSASEEENQGE